LWIQLKTDNSNSKIELNDLSNGNYEKDLAIKGSLYKTNFAAENSIGFTPNFHFNSNLGSINGIHNKLNPEIITPRTAAFTPVTNLKLQINEKVQSNNNSLEDDEFFKIIKKLQNSLQNVKDEKLQYYQAFIRNCNQIMLERTDRRLVNLQELIKTHDKAMQSKHTTPLSSVQIANNNQVNSSINNSSFGFLANNYKNYSNAYLDPLSPQIFNGSQLKVEISPMNLIPIHPSHIYNSIQINNNNSPIIFSPMSGNPGFGHPSYNHFRHSSPSFTEMVKNYSYSNYKSNSQI